MGWEVDNRRKTFTTHSLPRQDGSTQIRTRLTSEGNDAEARLLRKAQETERLLCKTEDAAQAQTREDAEGG
jgi:hypothetical protein